MEAKVTAPKNGDLCILLSTKVFLKLWVSTHSCRRQISDWLTEQGTLYRMYPGQY